MKKQLGRLVSILLVCALCAGLGGFALATETDPTALTEEEQALWYSKYYHDEPASPSEDIIAALQQPLSAEDVVPPDEVSLLYDFSQPFKTGYAVRDDGVAYAAVETVYEGVTLDMYYWYQIWAASQENQRLIYKMWNPGAHVRQELLGGTLWIQEDLGIGIENIISVGMSTPEQLGVSELVESNDSIIMTMAVNAIMILAEGTIDDNPMPTSLVHIYYINDNGYVVDRAVVYFGSCWINGTPLININGNEHQMASRAEGMAWHLAHEDANMAALIREVYSENSDTFALNGASMEMASGKASASD